MRRRTVYSRLIAVVMALVAALAAGCGHQPEQTRSPSASNTGSAARPSASSLEGRFSYNTMDRYVEAVTPLIRQWFDATWPQLPMPSRISYVPHGASGAEDCVTSSGAAAAYTSESYEYCPADRTVYLGQDAVWNFYHQAGDAGPAVALAHEFGHHVQQQVGVPSPRTPQESVNLENQADCIAGAWTRYADGQGWLEYPDDIQDIDTLFSLIGAAEGPDRNHGTMAERKRSFQLGVDGGISACNSFYPSTPLT